MKITGHERFDFVASGRSKCRIGMTYGPGRSLCLDVRERGEYNDGSQIPGTTSLPRSQIKFRIQSGSGSQISLIA